MTTGVTVRVTTQPSPQAAMRMTPARETPHGVRYAVELDCPGASVRLCAYLLPAAAWMLIPRGALDAGAIDGPGGDPAFILSSVLRMLEGETRRRDWPARGAYLQAAGEQASQCVRFVPFPAHGREWAPPPWPVAAAARSYLRAVRTALAGTAAGSAQSEAAPTPPRHGCQSSGYGPEWSDEFRCVVLLPGSAAEVLARQSALPAGLRRLVARNGYLLSNGEPVTLRTNVSAGDRLTVLVPAGKSSISPEPGELEVIYSDPDLLVVNKPARMLTHPARAERGGTLANRVAGYLARMGEPAIARPVGRLDRGVSGLVIFARTRYAHAALAAERRGHELSREYLAITGRPQLGGSRAGRASSVPVTSPPFDANRYNQPRKASTKWRFLAVWRGACLVLARPETGRTHQIRQHLAAAAMPLLGDTLYGGDCSHISRPALHAWRVRFRHPVDGREFTIYAPLAADMRRLAARIAGASGFRR